MKAGKSTETTGNRLDALDPGPAFDKAAAWEKLQFRLEKKKTGLYFPWKQAAAAVAALFLIAWLLMPGHKPAADNSLQPDLSIKSVKEIKAEPPVSAPGMVSANTGTVWAKQKPRKLKAEKTEQALPAAAAEGKLISQVPEQQVTVTPVPPNETTVIIKAKKKLPVVYNNELLATSTEESSPAGPENEPADRFPLFRKFKNDNSIKTEAPVPAESAPRRKGFLPFGISHKPKD